jgi:threonine synthase
MSDEEKLEATLQRYARQNTEKWTEFVALPHFDPQTKVIGLYCGNGPTGTHKDFKADYVVAKAEALRIKNVHLMTAGNAGISIKAAIERYGSDLKLISILPTGSSSDIKRELTGKNSSVLELDLNSRYIETKELSRLVPPGSWDVTNINVAYFEPLIEQALYETPDIISLSVGSGELFSAFYRHIVRERKRTKLVGVVPKGNHPFCQAARADINLFRKNYTGNTQADKLASAFISRSTTRSIEAAIRDGHEIIDATEGEFLKAMEYGSLSNVPLEFSGAAALVSVDKFVGKSILCVLTGKGRPYSPQYSHKYTYSS